MERTFWSKWRNNFLTSLLKRTKWKHDKGNKLAIGNIVTIKGKNPRIKKLGNVKSWEKKLKSVRLKRKSTKE
jgi:Family of unknown function (DUF5641)